MGTPKTSTQASANAAPETMDALCEGISRVIVDSLFHTKAAPEHEEKTAPTSELADTGVIAPLGDMVTEKAVSAVEGLLDSEEISDQILRVVQEKIVQVLNEDLAQSRKGDSGVIAERVHLECARLFGRETFRTEILRLLQFDLQRTVAPAIKRDVLGLTRRALAEFTEVVLERLGGLVRRIRAERGSREAPSPGSPEPAAEQAGPARAVDVPEIKREVLGEVRRELGRAMELMLDRLTDVVKRSRKADAAPLVGPSPGAGAVASAEEEAPGRIEQIRERLWVEGQF